MLEKRRNFIRFLGYVRPYSKYLLLAIIGGVVKFTVPLLVPQVTRYLLDDVFLNELLTKQQKIRELFFWVGGLIGIFLFIYTPWVYIRHWFGDKASHRAVFNLRCDLYYRILRMSASFFTRNKSGQIVSHLINDIQLAQNLVGTALTNVWMDAAAVLVVLYFLLRIDVPTTAAALATFPVYILLFRCFGTKLRLTTRRMQDEMATMSGIASEKISGSQVVHAFNQEKSERVRFHQESEKLFSTNMHRIFIQSLNQAVTGTLVSISPLIVVCFGGYRVITGHITVGELMAVTMYLAPLYLPLQRFSDLNVVFANSMAALDRIFEIMDEKPDIVDGPEARELESPAGHVEFRQVSFHYHLGCPVINEVSFKAEPGETIALVGPSGSGKTTIVNLIPRFYDPSSGQVLIDGQNVREIQLKSLRRHIGMVLQDPILFSGTIRENIMYGKPTAKDAEIIAACQAANAYDFICSLPKGFDTEIGERGASLSGGQKQRITIARAFLKDPRILILDEATSSLDSESEQIIHEARQRLITNRTSFIIAHRLSTIVNADKILVLQGGSVVETGTHGELLERGGIYYDYYHRQFKSAWSREATPGVRH